LSAMSKPTEPWGVVVDLGRPTETSTIVAYSNGEASIYFSSGGAFIGGVSHQNIQIATKQVIAAAAACQPSSQLTSSYPLPFCGQLNFYFLTDSGVFMATATEHALNNPDNPFSTLHFAAMKLFIEYILVVNKLQQEKKA